MLYVNYLICLALCAGIGYAMMLFALSECIKNDMDSINEMAKPKRNRDDLLKQFKFAVHCHSILIKLSVISNPKQFNNFMLKSLSYDYFFFQTIAQSIGYCSTDIHDTVHMEYNYDLWCNVSYGSS